MSCYPTFPWFPRISGYGRPLGQSGQPQSLTVRRVTGKQSVGHVEALEPASVKWPAVASTTSRAIYRCSRGSIARSWTNNRRGFGECRSREDTDRSTRLARHREERLNRAGSGNPIDADRITEPDLQGSNPRRYAYGAYSRSMNPLRSSSSMNDESAISDSFSDIAA
jgi:hypothetical protein